MGDQLKTTVKVVPRRRTRVRGRVSRPRTEAEQENIDIEKPVVPHLTTYKYDLTIHPWYKSQHTNMIIRKIRNMTIESSQLSCVQVRLQKDERNAVGLRSRVSKDFYSPF